MQWRRCVRGYELGQNSEGQILSSCGYRPEDFESYNPEREPRLFVAFSRIRTPEHCLAFAKKYGLLHGTQWEKVEDWLEAASGFRWALQTLKDEGWPRGPVRWLWLSETVSFWAKNGLHANMKPLLGRSGFFGAELTFEPVDLYGVLVLQLARHIAGQKEPRVCAHCGETFWLYAGKAAGRIGPKRSDAKYCSDYCRVMAFNKRHPERRKAAARAYYERTKANRPAPGSEGS